MSNSPSEESQIPSEFIGFGRGLQYPLQSQHQLPQMFPHPLNLAAFVASGRAPPSAPAIPNPYISSAPTLISPYNGTSSMEALKTSPHAAHNYSPYMTRFDQIMNSWPGSFRSLDIPGTVRSTKASRESTSYLKAWLHKHRKNPYPTKNQKIWLAYITNMTLTQVSTWFANARRRIKKEMASGKNHYGHEEDNDEDSIHDEDFSAERSPPEIFDSRLRYPKFNIEGENNRQKSEGTELTPSPRPRTSAEYHNEWPRDFTKFSEHKAPLRSPHDNIFRHSCFDSVSATSDVKTNGTNIQKKSDDEEDDEVFHDHDSTSKEKKSTIASENEVTDEKSASKSPFVKVIPKSNPENFGERSSKQIWSLAKTASESSAGHDESRDKPNRPFPTHFPKSGYFTDGRIRNNTTIQNKEPVPLSNDISTINNRLFQIMVAKLAEKNAMSCIQDFQNFIPAEQLNNTKEAFANALTASLMASLAPPNSSWKDATCTSSFRGSVMARLAPIHQDTAGTVTPPPQCSDEKGGSRFNKNAFDSTISPRHTLPSPISTNHSFKHHSSTPSIVTSSPERTPSNSPDGKE